MRILHLLSQTELTGAEVYAQNLVESQVRDGHQVHLISDRIHVSLPIAWKSLPISTSKLGTRIQNIKELRKYIQDEKIEVIHCHSRGAVRHAYWARWGLKTGMVTTLHGRQHFSWSKRLLHTYGEISLAVCENVKKAMELDFKMPGSSIRISRNPVPVLKESNPDQKEMDIPRLALIGRSSGPKGQRFEEIAFSCFQHWLEDISGLQISVIAPKPEKFSKAFLSEIEELNSRFPGSIRLMGHVSPLRPLLSEFDLVMGSGRVAIESLMDGTPVYAIGEYDSHGLVTLENVKEVLSSNFGDIGSQEREKNLPIPQIKEQVRNYFKNSQQSPYETEKLSRIIAQEFDANRIHQDVLEAYRAAIFKRWVPQWIPALMYHKIPDQDLKSRHRIFVTKERFEKHLQFFAKRKFQTLTFRDLKEYWNGERSFEQFPPRPLLLTFDDGYKDNLTNAEPLLRKYGFKATMYLLGNHQITENTWDSNTGEAPHVLMTLDEKKKLDPHVWEIGSHGFDHLHLTQSSESEIQKELKESKSQLEKDFQRPIFSFAYPFGSTSEELERKAKEAGYSFAVNTDQGGLHTADRPHGLFRVNIFPEDGAFELWKKTSTWYRKYFFRKRRR